jgi:DNA-binding HxlR family transcriptional regulator
MRNTRRSYCPISFALEIFGDKWSLLILRDLIFKDKVYYQDFADSEEGISTNILAERLERLKNEGLIHSKPDKENARKIIYSPTPKALDLIPIILEIIEWSAKYDIKTAAPKEFLKMLKRDRKALARQVRSKFEK